MEKIETPQQETFFSGPVVDQIIETIKEWYGKENLANKNPMKTIRNEFFNIYIGLIKFPKKFSFSTILALDNELKEIDPTLKLSWIQWDCTTWNWLCITVQKCEDLRKAIFHLG